MKQEYGVEYASARATTELVGRTKILAMIEGAIEKKSEQTQVIYITATGGMGKTRLLEEVVKLWGNPKTRQEKKLLIVRSLVDLYHTLTHTEEGLIAEIVDALDPDEKLFTQYIQKRAELAHMKFEGGAPEPIQGLRQEMIDTFLMELNALGEQYNKVVLVFDTAEVLIYETDYVQERLGLADQQIGVARWLIQDFIGNLRNVVVLIAGRPESPQLIENLEKTSARVIEYALPGFNEAETLAYFDAVAKVARIENLQSAKRIESIPEEIRRLMYKLTQGEPFLLALLIDYLAIAKEIPILESLESENFREALWDMIVGEIQEGERPLDQVVEALSWTPKGMGAELLAWALNQRDPTEEDVQEAQEAIDALREPEKRLSFVKIRSADDLVFLQDEMYALMAKVHQDSRAALLRNKINKVVLPFYAWKIRQTRRKIEEMEQEFQLIGEISAERITLPVQDRALSDEEKISKARARLQAYQVEQVYYTLQVDVLKGFALYSQYAEVSFQGRDLNLWLLLREELLRFADKNTHSEGLTWDDINPDMGIRWIQLALAEDQYQVAMERITNFRETCPELLQSGSYADLNLKIWETWILSYTSGKDYGIARRLLDEILEKARNLPSETSLDTWRISFLNAYAMSMQGFLHRMSGEFKLAVERYLQTVPRWRELKLELEASNNLNNLAWAEAEAGDFRAALTHCKDGLRMRRRLGKRNLIGLSLNTLGLIETRSGAPERARFHCEHALEIFRELENKSGIGLACMALAESLRRMTNADLLTRAQSLERLENASRYAEEAVKIFTEQVKQPLRQVEAYIEVGCVYREWARHLLAGDPERVNLIQKSQDAYEATVTIADEHGYEYRAIDALVNLAWLYYYVGDIEKARDILLEGVRKRFEDERLHLYTREHGIDASEGTSSWNWVQLGKANVLLGMIFFDEYIGANQLKDKLLAEQKLRQAAHNWTLAMAYNRLYGDDFRDFSKGRDDVYQKLDDLNVEEMGWVKSSMKQTHEEYHIEEDQRAFEQFLEQRFGFFA